MPAFEGWRVEVGNEATLLMKLLQSEKRRGRVEEQYKVIKKLIGRREVTDKKRRRETTRTRLDWT